MPNSLTSTCTLIPCTFGQAKAIESAFYDGLEPNNWAAAPSKRDALLNGGPLAAAIAEKASTIAVKSAPESPTDFAIEISESGAILRADTHLDTDHAAAFIQAAMSACSIPGCIKLRTALICDGSRPVVDGYSGSETAISAHGFIHAPTTSARTEALLAANVSPYVIRINERYGEFEFTGRHVIFAIDEQDALNTAHDVALNWRDDDADWSDQIGGWAEGSSGVAVKLASLDKHPLLAVEHLTAALGPGTMSARAHAALVG